MGRARDLANILSSSGNVALDSELGLSLITPTSIAATGGSGSISTSGTVTFTTCSVIGLNNIFSSSYTFYRVILSVYGSASSNYRVRLGTSGTAYAGADYFNSNYLLNTSNAATLSGAGSLTSWFIGSHASTANLRDINTIEIANPNITSRTTAVWSGYSRDVSRMQNGGGFIEQDTQYTDLFLVPDSGNITGTISVYGYRK
jgi:hypothetical protein